MIFGRWRSPTVIASGAPRVRWRVSAAVQGPMPGIAVSRRVASARSIRAASSIRRAARTARRIVDERLASTPARCHSQEGISAQPRGSGITRIRVAGAGAGLAVPLEQQPPGAVGLVAGDLLLQDRGDQRLQDQAGPRQPDAGVAAAGLMDDAVPGGQLRRVVGLPQQVGEALQQPVGARPPGLRLDAAGGRAGRDAQRAGALGRTAGPPQFAAAHRERGVAGTALEHTQGAVQVEAGRAASQVAGGHAARLGDAAGADRGPCGRARSRPPVTGLLVGGEAHRPGRDVGVAPDADAAAQLVVGADPRAVADDRAVQDRTGPDVRAGADQRVTDLGARPR